MLSQSEFIKHRKNLSNLLKPNSVLILNSKDPNYKRDGHHFSTPDSTLFYFTGITGTQTSYILYKDCEGKVSETLYLPQISEVDLVWGHDKITPLGATNVSGIKKIIFREKFEEDVTNLSQEVENIYCFVDPSEDRLGKSTNDLFIDSLKEKYDSKLRLKECFDIISSLREIKSKEEISQIKTALKTTQDGFLKILQNISTFKNEREIQATLSYEFEKNGMTHAYQPIVGSGKNACTLHYVKNNQSLSREDLVLIDAGAEFDLYDSDITRTYPLSGKFTPRQKEVYQAVLDVQKFAIENLKVGITKKELDELVSSFMDEKLKELNLSQKYIEVYLPSRKISNYYPHSIGHYLGLDTHDLGTYTSPIKEGVVMTIEPGIYIPEENIGIRIEDNVLVTKNGVEILSKDIPKEIEDIEKLANSNI